MMERTVSIALTASVMLALALLAGCSASRSPGDSAMLDILIRGGTVVDGTGVSGAPGDIGIRGGKMVVLPPEHGRRARRTIDASGLVVAPGFIDVHNHTVRALADSAKRFNEAFLRQGVTTVVGGPDGGYAPATIRSLVAEYEKNEIGTNVAFYIGHNGVRREVMDERQQRPPTPEELERMKALVREGMELGAVGLSTGLMYPPGMFSTTSEVVALAREVAPYGGVYDSHVRNPVWEWVESNREAIEIGARAGVPVKLGHVKAVGLHNTPKVDSLVAMVEAARARGVHVVSDQYPYDGAGGLISLKDLIMIERDYDENRRLLDDSAAVAKLLRDPVQRRRIQESSENGFDGGFSWIKAAGYRGLRVVSSEDYPELVGKFLAEAAQARGVHPFDLVTELVLDATAPVSIKGGIEERTIRTLLRQPWNMVASDGGYADADNGHPRATGTFPRVLGHYVRELGLLSVEEAVRKMTSLPADFIGLPSRGRIADGLPADIVVFDPATIADRSTYDRPNLLSVGVLHVFVNGVPVLLDGELRGAAPGRFLPRESSEHQRQ